MENFTLLLFIDKYQELKVESARTFKMFLRKVLAPIMFSFCKVVKCAVKFL